MAEETPAEKLARLRKGLDNSTAMRRMMNGITDEEMDEVMLHTVQNTGGPYHRTLMKAFAREHERGRLAGLAQAFEAVDVPSVQKLIDHLVESEYELLLVDVGSTSVSVPRKALLRALGG